MSDITKDAEAQIQHQGVASYRVKDGQVFVFTTASLENLLAASKEEKADGRVIVFVKSRPES